MLGCQKGKKVNNDNICEITTKWRSAKYNFTEDELLYLDVSQHPDIPQRFKNRLLNADIRYLYEIYGERLMKINGLGSKGLDFIRNFIQENYNVDIIQIVHTPSLSLEDNIKDCLIREKKNLLYYEKKCNMDQVLYYKGRVQLLEDLIENWF